MKKLKWYFFAFVLCISCSGSSSGDILDDDGQGLLSPEGAPVITSFTSDYYYLVVHNRYRIDYTPLYVEAHDPAGGELSYSFEVISDESGGTLTGTDGPRSRSYMAGYYPGEVDVRVTVTAQTGASAFRDLHLEVLEEPLIKLSEADFQESFPGETLYQFGESIACPGDLNGDGTNELAVTDKYSMGSAVYILFFNEQHKVKKYSKLENPFYTYQYNTLWISSMGDFDGDGVPDLVASSAGDICIILLNSDGSRKDVLTVYDASDYDPHGMFLSPRDIHGIGDFDHDGVQDLVVGNSAFYDTSGYELTRIEYLSLVLLNADGSIKSMTHIDGTSVGLTNSYSDDDSSFGIQAVPLGDCDNDGVPDLAVGAYEYGYMGAVYILFLNSNFTVKSYHRIDSLDAFPVKTQERQYFGYKICSIGDVDGNGMPDIAVGSLRYQADIPYSGSSVPFDGAVYILLLYRDGSVKNAAIISGDTHNIMNGGRDNRFGSALASCGDINKDGIPDFVAGARLYKEDPAEGKTTGAIWFVTPEKDGSI